MSLSKRGQNWAAGGAELLIWKVLKDLWDPSDNPNGYVSLGVAENALMHSELSKYIKENIQIPAKDLTYGDGSVGSKQLRAAAASFLTRKFKPVVDLNSEHVSITNGVSTGIEHLANILTNPGDAFLLGQPYYGAFVPDIELRTGTELVRVSFGDVDPISVDAVAAYKKTVDSCHAKGQRVGAIMLCNPHNPLGRCYPRDFIVELMKLCQKHKIHLVSDEIYAMSVFRTSSSSEVPVLPFTSLSAIQTEGLIDPALTHVLYGLSKDFGANGLRVGFIVSQHNNELHKALTPVSIYSYASLLADSAATGLLGDDKFVDWYISENQRRLKANYELVAGWADSQGIEYAKGVNAAFFLWLNFGKVYSASLQHGKIKKKPTSSYSTAEAPQEPPSEPGSVAASSTTDDLDAVVMDALLDEKIFLAAGPVFGSEKPGWFRIVFSQNQQILLEGLKRIEKALGLSSTDQKSSGTPRTRSDLKL